MTIHSTSSTLARLRNREDRELFALRRQERAAEAVLADFERELAKLGERLEEVAQEEERAYRRMHFGHGPHEDAALSDRHNGARE